MHTASSTSALSYDNNRLPPVGRRLALGALATALTFLAATAASAQIVINEIMVDVEQGLAGDANGDGVRSFRADEFIELVNNGVNSVDIGGWTIQQEDEDVVFTFPDNTILQPGEFTVVFGGVGPNGFGPQFPAGLQLFASQQGEDAGFAPPVAGGTNFSSTGDNIVLRDDQGVAIAEVYWGSNSALTSVGELLAAPNTVDGVTITPNTDEAITRAPDKDGLWAAHSDVDNRLFSPGAFNTGEFRDPPVGEQRFLNVSVSGQGDIDLSPFGGVYNDGTVVTLTANPEDFWEFDSWSGDIVSTDSTIDITMDANKSVNATFQFLGLPPIADANGPYIGVLSSAITFSSDGSNDPDGEVDAYLWDFGDGQTSNAANPSHIYAAAGNYIVTLTVTDNTGQSSAPDVTSAYVAEPSGDTVPLTFDNFEQGFGNFTSGGNDALLYTGGVHSSDGTNALNIQDDRGINSAGFFTNSIDIRSFSSIEIDFHYSADGVETGEDFFVQFFDGSAWRTIATFVAGVDFQAGDLGDDFDTLEFQNPKLIVSRSDYNFSSNMRIRFLNDANGNSDDIYIDEVRVSGVPAATYSLTTSTIGQGSVNINSESGVFIEDSIASVEATPVLGWEFLFWQNALSGSSNPGLIFMNSDKAVTAVFRELPFDDLPPSPDPMQWQAAPSASSSNSITMTAVTAFDSSGVEYFFEETSGNPGGDDSGWQSSPTYTDTGLSQGTSYAYRVRARDRSLNQNTTDWSILETAETFSTPVGIDQEGPLMALAGDATFSASGSGSGGINWSVDRLTRNEKFGGLQIRESDVFSATGASATFDLTKIAGQETIYEITASDGGFTETITVQVFEPNAINAFIYESDGNPDVPVYIVVPESLSENTKLISVHHGSGRGAIATGAIRWLDWASNNDYIAVAPEFSDSDWPGSRSYNLGNMFTGNDGAGELNPESRWSYTIARDIALKALNEFDLNDEEYDIWGHSAGGQFSHRMMIFRPDAPIRWALPANPGWWTLPSLDEDYPYGLRHPLLSISEEELQAWTNRPMIIFIGEDDTGLEDVRTTPEANAQGANRYERAFFMFDRGLEANPNNAWEIREVAQCGHDSGCMSPPAHDFLSSNTTLGDFDADGDVDRNDLTALLRFRNQPAQDSDDPRDLDGDGMITALDARILQQLCTRPRCATE